MATQAQLEEARSALHDLITGNKARVVVDQNGERVEFTATSRAALAQYIQQLEVELGLKARTNRPLKVFY